MSTNTQDRLLDAAEQLIAQKGYANTSLREITTSAEANLAAVNYHFGSKEGLLSAMLTRRLDPMNQKRVELLDIELRLAEKEGRRPDTRRLLKAFIEPVVTFFKSQPGGKHFLRIVSRIHSDPDDAIRQEFMKHMVPVFMQFFHGFQKALPDVAPEILVSRIFFCIGALGHGASILVDDDLCKQGSRIGLPAIPDSKTLVEELLAFAARGMEA